jgi:PadR family transcriptional regulator, regulatory protein PadR
MLFLFRKPILRIETDLLGGGVMEEKVLRKLFLGFIQIHILHHAKEHPIYGMWMLEELKIHGYNISPGTLYPILHNMESDGLLRKEEKKWREK